MERGVELLGGADGAQLTRGAGAGHAPRRVVHERAADERPIGLHRGRELLDLPDRSPGLVVGLVGEETEGAFAVSAGQGADGERLIGGRDIAEE